MRVIEQGSEPFRWWRLADVADPVLMRAAVANIPPDSWPNWVRYSNDIEHGKRTTRDLGSQHYALMEFGSTINSSQMAWDLGRITGIGSDMPDPDQHGAGLHITDPGGWLQVHVDYEVHPRLKGWERRLNLILWLNPEWKQEWGGALIICDGTGKAERAFYPTPGEAVLFECGPAAYHGAMQTSLDAPPRITLAAYYLAQARPTATRRRALFMPNRNSPECPSEVRIPKNLNAEASMPHQKQIDYDPAMVRLRKIFHDADISVQMLQVVGAKGQFPGTEITFIIDLGYPTHFVASMFVSTKEQCQSSNAKLREIVSLRTDAVVRYLLQETGRTERAE